MGQPDSVAVDNVLAHYGTKGMKWGVRKDLIGVAPITSGGKPSVIGPENISKPTKRELNTVGRTTSKVRDALFAPDGPIYSSKNGYLAINDKYSGKNLSDPKTMRAYNEELSSYLTKEAKKLVPEGGDAYVHLTAFDGFLVVGNTADISAFKDSVRHSASDVEQVNLSVVRDEAGLVQSIMPVGLKHDDILTHYGTKGMKWGVRKDERPLLVQDQKLNISQRSQVKLASGISALAAIGITSNAAATMFQLQSRWEHLKILEAVADQAQNNPFISEAGKEALKQTRNNVIRGLVTSAAATTAVSATIGIVTHRTAKAFFAPLHKVYGDAKPKINGELKALRKDIEKGKRPSMTAEQYNKAAADIVKKHMTADKPNLIQPFHELARSQLGTEYNTKSLTVKFEKLPNTALYNKMTVTTPEGLKLVKAVRNLNHSAVGETMSPLDFYFDYEFDAEGAIVGFSCPTIEIGIDILNETLDVADLEARYPLNPRGGTAVKHDNAAVDNVLAHYGIKGMKWGVRRSASQLATAARGKIAARKAAVEPSEDAQKAAAIAAKINKGGDLRRLSNAEIQTLSARIRLEQEYARLSVVPPGPQSRISRGKDFATKLASDIAKEQIRRVAKEAVNVKVNEVALKKGLVLDKKSAKKAQAVVDQTLKTAGAKKAPKPKKQKTKTYTPTPLNLDKSLVKITPG